MGKPVYATLRMEFVFLIFDKVLLSMDRSIGGLFLLVKGYMDRKAGAGDAVGKGRWGSGRSFEKSAHLLVESPVKRAFLSTIQADLFFTMRYDWMYYLPLN